MAASAHPRREGGHFGTKVDLGAFWGFFTHSGSIPPNQGFETTQRTWESSREKYSVIQHSGYYFKPPW